MALLLASLLQSCAQVDVKRMTYKALRQHDCRINEPNAFCERSFSQEYIEYERLRQEFLHDKQTTNYRVAMEASESASRELVQ